MKINFELNSSSVVGWFKKYWWALAVPSVFAGVMYFAWNPNPTQGLSDPAEVARQINGEFTPHSRIQSSLHQPPAPKQEFAEVEVTGTVADGRVHAVVKVPKSNGSGGLFTDQTDLVKAETWMQSILGGTGAVLWILVPFIIMGLAYWYFNRRGQGVASGLAGIPAASSRAHVAANEKAGPLGDWWLPGDARFESLPELSEVKGVNEVTEELEDTVEFIKNLGEAYRAEVKRREEAAGERKKNKEKPVEEPPIDLAALVDANSPFNDKPFKRVCFYGEPGTGKTMIGKAVARAADVPVGLFDFSTMHDKFIGVGGANIKKMFEEIVAHSPCVVIWDELDSMGKRDNGVGGGAEDENKKVINLVLRELDGFDQKKLFGVVMVGMTNFLAALDQAFLRPGRFHPQIEIPKPNIEGVGQIFESHFKKNKLRLAPDVNLMTVFRLALGQTGATIQGCVLEAMRLAGRLWRKDYKQLLADGKSKEEAKALLEPLSVLKQEHLIEGLLKVLYGLKKKKTVDAGAWAETIVHEGAGHACVQAFLTSDFYRSQKHWHKWMTSAQIFVRVVETGEPRGNALGFVISTPNDNLSQMKHTETWGRAAVVFAGGLAQQVFFGLSAADSGHGSDLDTGTQLIHQAITQHGASSKVGRMMIGRKGASGWTEIGEEKKGIIDEEVYLRVKLTEAMTWWILSVLARSEALISMLEEMAREKRMFEDRFYELFEKHVMPEVEQNWRAWQPVPLEELMETVKYSPRSWDVPEQLPEVRAILDEKAAKLVVLCQELKDAQAAAFVIADAAPEAAEPTEEAEAPTEAKA